MDSERDKEKFQGREVFVSQLLDWDSLIHQLIIPADKAEAFKAHYSVPDVDGKPYHVTIMLDGEGYKAFAIQTVLSSANERVIQLIYSPQLADALKNKFNDLYKRMSRNREMKDVDGIDKTHIYLVIGYSSDVFILHYSTKSSFQLNPNSWRKVLKVERPYTRPQMDTSSKQSTQVSVTSKKDTEINEKTSELSFTSCNEPL